ncbi:MULTISPECIES: AIR synthase-related protein [unclassified Archaeoglobus]|uniref:AIR synthase-related protein n=1 Tax=unclassified Archaeoglobus TaxID=2643606 RepID=UPI0025BDBFBB|nr:MULTISPECIES: AIR synthase-related protein [unclassified Archaeoglobus]
MDIEGYARRMLEKTDETKVKKLLAERIAEIKGWNLEKAERWARAVIVEVKNAYSKKSDLLDYYRSGVTMGAFGVGSRGRGDFYVHEKIAEVIGESGAVVSSAVVSSKDLDDAGVVRHGDFYIAVAIDGIHSRLSEFPFIAGFHVTRAAMRDVYVMGAEPVAVFSDIHIADDGDVSKIFDHLAGISAVCDATGVPLISGSTLRIGGDMVIGERMTGGVGCVGVSKYITPRKNVREEDVILLTEGAGGGTVATTAIYYGMHEIVEETINLDFIKAVKAIFANRLVERVHSMSDVTNGGIRGDAEEISKVSGKSLVFEYEKLRKCVNPRVLEMLEELEIDFMGVSIDSLMIVCDKDVAKDVIKAVKGVGVQIQEVGWVEDASGKPGAFLVENGERKEIKPRFRESAYTPLKKVVGEEEPPDFEEMRQRVDEAVRRAVEKKKKVLKQLGMI